MVEKRLYRVSEAADAISVSRSLCYALIRSGEIPAMRGRVLYVPIAWLWDWVARQPIEPVPLRRRVQK